MALEIAGHALTIVGARPKSGGLAKISGVSLELASGPLNMGATRHNYSAKMLLLDEQYLRRALLYEFIGKPIRFGGISLLRHII